MGDEGVGVEAARRLAGTVRQDGVEVLDGGTGGFHLLSHLDGIDRLILIDAADDGAPIGTVKTLRPRFVSEFPPALSAHEIGLRDLLESAALLGTLPTTELVTVSVETPLAIGPGLSPAVDAALPEVLARVHALLEQSPEGTTASGEHT